MDFSADFSTVQDVNTKEVDVSIPEPLTGKERAGVSLTWGIMVILVFFLVLVLGIFIWGEYHFFAEIGQLQDLAAVSPEISIPLTELMANLETEQASFRAFWFGVLNLILLNVLFPTLTALLGYVFGTSRANNSPSIEVRG